MTQSVNLARERSIESNIAAPYSCPQLHCNV
jgi:hypothetical protein